MLIKTWSQDGKPLMNLLPAHLQSPAGSKCLNTDFSMKKQRFLALVKKRCCSLSFSFIRTSETVAVTGDVLQRSSPFTVYLGTAERVMGAGAGTCLVPFPGKQSPSFSNILHLADQLPPHLLARPALAAEAQQAPESGENRGEKKGKRHFRHAYTQDSNSRLEPSYISLTCLETRV